MLRRGRQQQYNESVSDTLRRYQGVILVISVPLLIICLVLVLMPAARTSSNDVFVSNRKFLPNVGSPVALLKSYVVVFDAGSSGSRVHVFCFDQNLDLMHIGDELEVFYELKPGLSANAKDPKVAAETLLPLLEKAEKVVPQNMRKTTPVKVGVSDFKSEAAKTPNISNGDDTFLKEMSLLGTKYYLYVHSYLNYGLLAARAKILEMSKDSENPCVLSGYNGVYSYGGIDYKVSSLSSGSSMNKCMEKALKVLKVNESNCSHANCTFGGGGGERKDMFVASFFYDSAAQAGLIDASKPVAKVHPIDFKEAAERVCATKLDDAKSRYPRVGSSNLPYLCMDLVYEFMLLVNGFGLDLWQEITLVKKIKYQDSLVEAAWPLGSAIEVVSAAS
ncbi:apyrase 2-like [Bidens hawaiensis]|uniref:apyrase 2-like n=1 Tax=Bidens hawaiensis TaxID=980011 RepID=UPI00404B3435